MGLWVMCKLTTLPSYILVTWTPASLLSSHQESQWKYVLEFLLSLLFLWLCVIFTSSFSCQIHYNFFFLH